MALPDLMLLQKVVRCFLSQQRQKVRQHRRQNARSDDEPVQGRGNKTKTELGKILGVDRTTIGFYEEGKRRASINYLHRFCEHFRISMDEFISKRNQ